MAASNTSSEEVETSQGNLSRSSGSALGETERGSEGDLQGLPEVYRGVQTATRYG